MTADYKALREKQLIAQSLVQFGALYERQDIKDAFYICKGVSMRETDLEPFVTYGKLGEEGVAYLVELETWLAEFTKRRPVIAEVQ